MTVFRIGPIEQAVNRIPVLREPGENDEDAFAFLKTTLYNKLRGGGERSVCAILL
jgi:hypothetical protein